jgi:RNA polymerase sigma-70 factor (ECF subfamily)
MPPERARPIDVRPVPTIRDRILASLPDLRRFVSRRMGPALRARESASDIVQSTCGDLLRNADAFEERGGQSFDAWLRAAAENKLRNRARHWKAERRRPTPGQLGEPERDAADDRAAAEETQPDCQAELQDEVERLRTALEALPAEQRRILELSQIQGRSHAEIAAETGRSSEAVRKLVARALARLSADLVRERGARPQAR